MRSKRGGFTLIELLIVLVIIGVLAAIAVPKFDFTRRRGYRSALKSDLRNLAMLQDLYYSENYTYTTDLSALNTTLSDGVNLNVVQADGQGWAATATHDGLDSNDGCAIYLGEATAPSAPGGATPSSPGVVACDGA